MNHPSPEHAHAHPPAFTLRALHRRTCVDTWLKALGTAVGMSAFFVGYNHVGDKTEYIRPVVGNGTRWGTDMKAPKGTGLSVLSLHDYVVTYNSASRVMTAYMNGAQAGSMNAGGFAGLASLSEGIVVGGVRNSAFRDDSSAPVNIRSFLVYSGVLSPGQVAKLHAVGPVPGLDALGMADVVVR